MLSYREHHRRESQRVLASFQTIVFEGLDYLVPPGAEIRKDNFGVVYCFLWRKQENVILVWWERKNYPRIWDQPDNTIPYSPDNFEALNQGNFNHDFYRSFDK